MASTYSNYKIELIGNGDQPGTWGTTTNANFGNTVSGGTPYQGIEQAIGGYASISYTTSLALTDTNGPQNGRALFLNITGSPGADATITLPSIQKLYFIKNALSTTYNLLVKTSTATTITVPYGKTACIYVDGTDVVGTSDYLPSLTTTTITASGAVSVAGNFSSGTSTTTSGTYGRSLTTVTVTSATHGFSNGQVLYLVFSAGTGGTATSGIYTIANVTTNTFEVTDTATGSITGGPAVSITKYNNTITFTAPVSSFGSSGTTGQVLVSQGSGAPPTWSTVSSIAGNWTVGGNLAVTGTSTFTGAATFNGNTTIGSTTVTSGTYGRSTTTVTVTSNSHGFSNGQVLYLVFSAGTGGTATSGVYAISNVATNTFDVTDTASGTITGTPAVSITKYNNTATLQAPLSSFGSVGTSGYVLTSQGAGAPPQWTSRDTSTLVNGTTKLSVDSSGNFTAVVPSDASLTPAFFPRAWVNFDGTTSANVSGTYSQSGTTVTVTITGHGLIAGNVIYADATTGTAVDGTYTVATVTDANTFTYTAGTSLTTTGNITLLRRNIRGSGNVGSVTYLNATGRFYINFSTAMTDANYCLFGTGSRGTPAFDLSTIISIAATPTTAAVGITSETEGGTPVDPLYGCVTVIR